MLFIKQFLRIFPVQYIGITHHQEPTEIGNLKQNCQRHPFNTTIIVKRGMYEVAGLALPMGSEDQ